MSKYGHRNMDWFEGVVNKIGGEEGAERFLRGELVVSEPSRVSKPVICEVADYKKLAEFVSPQGTISLENFRKCLVSRWREQDGVIYFKVTSNGMTGSQWIEHFEKKSIQLSKWAKDVLLSPDFKPTNGVTTEVAVLKGILFTDDGRITAKIRAYADKLNIGRPNCKLVKPEAELGCLIRDTFTDEEIEAMGLVWVVAFHEPIKDSDGGPFLLSAYRYGDGLWLCAFCGKPGGGWGRGGGFAFAVSQVSS